MKADKLIEAIGGAKAEYLMHCEANETTPIAHSRKLMRRALLAAAILVLCVTAAAASVAIAHNIRGRAFDAPYDGYQLYFEQNPAAVDAPEWIEEYYLPSFTQFHFEQDYATLSGNRFANYSWYSPDGQVTFAQRPLRLLDYGNVFVNMGGGGLRLEELQQDSITVDGTEYARFTYQSEFGTAVYYYWIDAAHHYVFELFCNEGISEHDRMALLRSVKPVGKNELVAMLNPQKEAVWMPDIDLARYPDFAWSLSGSPTGTSAHFNWQDDLGLGITLEQAETNIFDLPIEAEQKTVNGMTVTIGKCDTSIDTEEKWLFSSSDGMAYLQLTFSVSKERDDFSAEEKEAIFKSIHPITSLGSLINGE